jgi:capsule polysaccharide export protein KpsE/RkpR
MRTANLDESSQLELTGAEHRLENAIRALRNFQNEHGILDDRGFVFQGNLSPELRSAFERELYALHIELDEAFRALKHAQAVASEDHPAK